MKPTLNRRLTTQLATANLQLSTTANKRKYQLAVIRGFPIANTVNMPKLLYRLRFRAGDLAERRVVEDDVRRHAPASRDFEAQDA